MTDVGATSALANLHRIIPIDNHHCFTQRFSPTGFILNALNPNWCHRIASARIQVKTYPISSILAIAAMVQMKKAHERLRRHPGLYTRLSTLGKKGYWNRFETGKI